MPPKKKSVKELKVMRDHFRSLVDGAFGGNLSEAGRILDMPLGTVQQYYTLGPRRLSPKIEGRFIAASLWLIQYERTLEEIKCVEANVETLKREIMRALYVVCQHAPESSKK